MSEKGFDRDTYFALLGEDPVAAANYIDQVRYNHANPVGAISEAVNSALAQRESAVANEFLQSQSDFPAGNTEAAEAMRQKVSDLVSQGMPFNRDTMDFAYFSLLKSGQIEPESQRSERATNQEPTEADIAAEIAKAEQMSDKDLKALLDKNGMFR